MSNHDYFELRRKSDDLIYQFDRLQHADGRFGYKRRDQDLWIFFMPEWGWMAWDEETQTVSGRPWNVLPKDQQEDHPPAGEWVSKKGIKSYVYELVYGELTQ